MNRRSKWSTRYSIYLLAIGSALGLGNLWRFPYVVGENGGGAFVLLYVFLALTVGLPIMIAELILGRFTGQSVVMAMNQIGKRSNSKMRHFGFLSVIVSLVVLSYYSVISGWVLHFITRFFIDSLAGRSVPDDSLQILLQNSVLQWALCSVHILVCLFVILKGIQQGIEKWLQIITPLFAVLMVVLIFRTLALPSTGQVLRFLFYPDFSKLTVFSLNQALAHVFFTLSLGFGTLVTYGSYIREDQHVPTAGFRVTMVDIVVSLAALLLVFPVAFQMAGRPLTDPSLVFQVLPSFFSSLQVGSIFGLGFFVCLYLAAFNASLGLFETVVSNIGDHFKNFGRKKAGWLAAGICLILSLIPAFSTQIMSFFEGENKGLIELMDSFLINGILPLVALGVCLIFSRGLTSAEKEKHFVDKQKFVSYTMYPQWLFALKWFAPGVILLGWILQVYGLLK